MATDEEYTPGGGLAAGWQQRLTPEQEQSLEVQKVLFQHSQPYTYLLEDWQDRATQEASLSPEEWRAKVLTQPSDEELHNAMNVALSFGMGTVEPVSGKVAKGLVEGVEKKGLKDPKLKINIDHLHGDRYRASILTKENDQFVGHVNFTTDPVEKSIHIDYASIPEAYEGKFGTGQLRHVTREMADRFPDMERVDFVRVSGAARKNMKPELEHVSMPLRPENPMFRKLVEQERPSEEFMGPMPGQKRQGVIRTKIGKPQDQVSVEGDSRLNALDREAVYLAEQGVFDWQMPEGEFNQAVTELGPERAANLENQKYNQIVGDAARERRRNMSPDHPDYDALDPDEAQMPGAQFYRRRLDEVVNRLEGNEQQQPFFRMTQEEADAQAARVGGPEVMAHREAEEAARVELRNSQAQAELHEWQQYERRAEAQGIHPEIERKIFNYAEQEGVSENQALTVYNHIMDRMQREGTERVLGEEMARIHEQRIGAQALEGAMGSEEQPSQSVMDLISRMVGRSSGQ